MEGVKVRILGILLQWHGLGFETNMRQSTKRIPEAKNSRYSFTDNGLRIKPLINEPH